MSLLLKFGAGSAPAGVGPCGVEPPPDLPQQPPDMPDGVPAFEVAERDYTLDQWGRLETVHPYDQEVQFALGIKRGSLASNDDVGHLLNLAETQGGAALVKRKIENQVRRSVAMLVTDGKISVNEVTAEVTTQAVLVMFRYTNLGTGKPEELRYTYGGT